MSQGSVVSIYLHTGTEGGEPMAPVDSARVVSGGGLLGDRFFQGEGSTAKKRGPDREVTLIEAEAIEAIRHEGKIELGEEESRRNIVTRGIALNHLVDKQFRVGSATLRGIRSASPASTSNRSPGPACSWPSCTGVGSGHGSSRGARSASAIRS